MRFYFPALFSLFLFVQTSQATPPPDVPVTQKKFNLWMDWIKTSIENLNRRERKVEEEEQSLSAHQTVRPKGANEEAVDLLGAPPNPQTPPAESGEGGTRGPNFTTLFDLNFVNQPGTNDSLAFDNYHSFLFFDIAPRPDLTFSFNLLGPTVLPIFYELDYQATTALTLRAGKIWIPFDDLSSVSPHNIFGGRVGLLQLMPTSSGNGGDTFLPSVWTELGVGADLMLVDSKILQLKTSLCVLNGFTDKGIDPVTGGEYPSFSEFSPSTQSSSGNHRDKSIALRAHALWYSGFGMGVSYYTGQWNQDSDPAGPLRMNIVGGDGQAHLFGLDFRAGTAWMSVQLPGDSTVRTGTYGEVGLPFAKNKWKILARAGTLDLDSRAPLPTNETIVGGTLLYNPGMVQFSIEHSRDITDPGVPVGFISYTDIRMVMMF